MLVVIRDILHELLGDVVDAKKMVFIGDAEQDRKAAHAFGIPFFWAQDIHRMPQEKVHELMKTPVIQAVLQ